MKKKDSSKDKKIREKLKKAVDRAKKDDVRLVRVRIK